MTTLTPSRAVAIAAALFTIVLAGCGDQPAGDSAGVSDGDAPATQVAVSVDDGAGGVQSFTLTCGEAPAFTGGDTGDRDATAACGALVAHDDRLVMLSDPEREPEMCTEIYGGPDTATISGTVDGDEVDVDIARNNGCGIADWDALEPLLGPPAQGGPEPVG